MEALAMDRTDTVFSTPSRRVTSATGATARGTAAYRAAAAGEGGRDGTAWLAAADDVSGGASEDETAVGACIDEGAPVLEAGSLSGQGDAGGDASAPATAARASVLGTRRRSGRRGSGRQPRRGSGSGEGRQGWWAGWVASLQRLARRLVRLARGKGTRARVARLLLLAVVLLALWLLR